MAEIILGGSTEQTPDGLTGGFMGASSTNDMGSSASENSTFGGNGSNESVYSNDEMQDPNRIMVTIADATTPIVILFGPPASGKTMTLVRLTRYLRKQGYSIKPVTSFRPSHDRNYKEMCDNFDLLIDSDDAAKSTSNINFMLVHVLDKRGRPICQILEAPGEHYFLGDTPKAPFPTYVNRIKSAQNRRVWLFLVEPDATGQFTQNQRTFYSNKIANLMKSMPSKDKSIIVFNKIDASDYVMGRGKVNMSAAQKYIGDIYPRLYEPFTNDNPITKWVRPYNCDFVPFQTGDYMQDANGGTVFTDGPDEYPCILWVSMLKNIKG